MPVTPSCASVAARVAGKASGVGASVAVSGWLPAAVFADNELPPLPATGNVYLLTLGVIVLMAVARQAYEQRTSGMSL